MGWLRRLPRGSYREAVLSNRFYVSGVDMWRRGPGAANFAVMTTFAATYYSDEFQQLQHSILGFETGGVFAGDARLVQPSAHHLDIRGGVAMRGGDLRMP